MGNGLTVQHPPQQEGQLPRPEGFGMVLVGPGAEARETSVVSYLRTGETGHALVVLNLAVQPSRPSPTSEIARGMTAAYTKQS